MRKAVGLGLLALCFSAWWFFGDGVGLFGAQSIDKPGLGAPQSATTFSFLGAASSTSSGNSTSLPSSAKDEKIRQEKVALWSARYELAQSTYNAYRDETRYPFTSRPISQAPDQIRPFDPVVSEGLARNERGEPLKGVVLKVGQDRVHLSGTDTAKFTLQAADENGKQLPLLISRAIAQALPVDAQQRQLPTAMLDFSDKGQGSNKAADDIANDGIFSARLSPASQGFKGFNGTIRTLIYLRVDGKDSVASIDVIYSEDIPATWGVIREVKEQGSLSFYLKADVLKAGRYLVSARVDDANGKPFAILRFNEEVAAGQQELKLQLFGLLIRDKRPEFPLKLRDISGYMLVPNSFPDRFMMENRPGVHYTSRAYSLDSFSPDEWSDEQRNRYLTEYGNDVDRARRELDLLGYK
jgi:hypothetical protein